LRYWLEAASRGFLRIIRWPYRALPAAFSGDLAARIPAVSSIGSAISHADGSPQSSPQLPVFIAACVKSWTIRI